MNILTVPLSLSDIESNYGKKIVIDYSLSTIKGSKFLTYLSNLNMDYNIIGIDKCTIDEKIELLSSFINSRKVLKFPEVISAYYKLIFNKLNIEHDYESFISNDDAKYILEKNSLLVTESILFITFCYPLMLLIINDDKDIIENLKRAPKLKSDINITNGMISLLYSNEWGILVSHNYQIFDLTSCISEYDNMPLHMHIFNEKNTYSHCLLYAKKTI